MATKKTTLGFDKAAQVKKFLSNLTNGYAAIYNSCLIEMDSKTSIKHWMEFDKECKSEKTYYEFFIGIRKRGIESGYTHSHIEERVQVLQDTLICDVRVTFFPEKGGYHYFVEYTRAI